MAIKTSKKLDDKKKKEFDRTKPHYNIGGLGHIDSGKTSMAAAISKLQHSKGLAALKGYRDIDNSPEERVRGITINATHIEFETDKHHYSFVDAPGHRDYIKNCIAGIAQMELAIMLISSIEGVESQTKEHLLLAKQIGIKKIIVLINDKTREQDGGKIDEETKQMLIDDVETSLKKYGFEPAKTPIFVISVLKALNYDYDKKENDENKEEVDKLSKLLEAVDELVLEIDYEEDYSKPFLMYLEGKHQIVGQGTVITGKVLQGSLKSGDTVRIEGFGLQKTITVRSIEMHGREVEEAIGRDSVGLNIRGAEFKEVKKGQAVLGMSSPLTQHSSFEVYAYIQDPSVGRKTPFGNNYRPQIYAYTANVTGIITLPEGKTLVYPDSLENFRIDLIHPLVLKEGDSIIIREGSVTVAGAKITKIIS